MRCLDISQRLGGAAHVRGLVSYPHSERPLSTFCAIVYLYGQRAMEVTCLTKARYYLRLRSGIYHEGMPNLWEISFFTGC
jgi:hypothetical protein